MSEGSGRRERSGRDTRPRTGSTGATGASAFLGLALSAALTMGCDLEPRERERWVERSGRIEVIGVDGRRLEDGARYRIPLDGGGLVGDALEAGGGLGLGVPLGAAVREALVIVNDTSEEVAVALWLVDGSGAHWPLPGRGAHDRGEEGRWTEWSILEPTRASRVPLIGARLLTPGGHLDFDVELRAREVGRHRVGLAIAWGTERGSGQLVELEAEVFTPPERDRYDGAPREGRLQRPGRPGSAETQQVELAEGVGVLWVPGLVARAEEGKDKPLGLLDERHRARATELARQGDPRSSTVGDREERAHLPPPDEQVTRRAERHGGAGVDARVSARGAGAPTLFGRERREDPPVVTEGHQLALTHGEPAPGGAGGEAREPRRHGQDGELTSRGRIEEVGRLDPTSRGQRDARLRAISEGQVEERHGAPGELG